ncbi:MAG: hypothetical protein K1X67_12905 [Fimbriimonadaceae bacterium]|nr:hypothetical protein [Fimbriimonadaceae bacterium]
MKRLWILIALGAMLVGCNSGGETPKADAGKSTAPEETKTTETEAKKEEKKNPEIVTTKNSDGTVTQKTKDGKAEMTINEKTGLGTVKMVDKNGKPMSIDRTGEVPMSEVSVPDYPNSTVPPKEPKVLKITAFGGWEWGMIRMTADGPDKIFEFYKAHVKDAKIDTKGDPQTMKGKSAKGDNVSIAVKKIKDGEYRLSIGVRRRDPNVKLPDKPKPSGVSKDGPKTSGEIKIDPSKVQPNRPIPGPKPAPGGPPPSAPVGAG